ncbi:MAG: glycosyltransferase family 4 protein [Prevotellaceae bacterium]|jgi:glycosyltransferase involved in cell wall biosynthesis|nr:glycosyltransferase family 4 protein [Prevotellaceae bacterium]
MTPPKQILIDLLRVKEPHTGLGQVGMAYGRALAAIDHPAMRFTFLVPPAMTGCFGDTVHYITPSPVRDLLSRYRLPGRFDLWHSTHQDVRYRPDSAAVYVLTVHDLNFIREKSPVKITCRKNKMNSLLRRADAVVAISRFTKQDMAAHLTLRTPVEVIYNGVDKPSGEASGRPAFAFDGDFFFAIGVFKPNKNYESLVRLMHAYPDSRLIIAGTYDSGYGKSIINMIHTFGLQDRILTPGAVSEAEKAWLYAHCKALLFPSTNEGMGMPVIEAMHWGKPVVASPMSCIPEFGGEYAYYFTAMNPAAMRATVEESLAHHRQHPESVAAMQRYAAQFSWAEHAAKYVRLFERELRIMNYGVNYELRG